MERVQAAPTGNRVTGWVGQTRGFLVAVREEMRKVTWRTRDELLNEVWGYNAMPSTRTVDVHVAWLRQKLEDNPRHPQYILTVHGLGYKFVA